MIKILLKYAMATALFFLSKVKNVGSSASAKCVDIAKRLLLNL